MKQILFGLLILSIFSCKNDNSNNKLEPIDPVLVNGAPPVDPKNLKVPSAASMITAAEVQDILNTSGNVVAKESNDPTNDKSKSCFFKWDDPNTPNAGILIQVMANPVYEDYPEYIANFVSSKLKEGETVMGQDTPTMYKEFDANGRPGAYSFQQARFYWAGDNNYLFMLAFNVSTLSESKMVKAAEKIAKIVNRNFAKTAGK
jgi:hypothetical protein